MCPEGAVHVPFRGTMRVCKRLQIDYAEAVVDFEFGHRMAVPVIQGVVIAEEYHDQVMEELQKDEEERSRKENEKRRKAALGKWRKFLMGMRIIQRIRQDYGEIGDDVSVFKHSKGTTQSVALPEADDEETAGGFLPEGYEEEAGADDSAHHNTSSFFPVVDEDDMDGENDLIMEDHRQEETTGDGESGPAGTIAASRVKAKARSSKPAKKQAQKPAQKPAQKVRSSRRRQRPVSEDEDAGDDEDGQEDEWVNPDDGDD